MKHTTSWKTFEYRIAELFGGIRNAFSGACPALTGTRSDVRHPYLYIEAKYRQKHSLATIWKDAKVKADCEHKIPVVCLAEHGKHGCWIVIHSNDLDRLAKAGDYTDLPMFANVSE